MVRYGVFACACTLVTSLGCASGDDSPPADPLQPEFGVGIRAPITGGTLVAAPSGEVAYASYPDLDSVARVDFWAGTMELLPLGAGAQPGRLALDAQGLLHVLKRGTGELADVDVSGRTLKLVATRAVCAEPRGITVDGPLLHVACGGGDLVTFPASGGPEVARVFVERDLRDVVMVNGKRRVSTFRTANLVGIDEGTRVVPPSLPVPADEFAPPTQRDFISGVAWRTIAAYDGSTVMTFQRGLLEQVTPVKPASLSATCEVVLQEGYYTEVNTVACPRPPTGCETTLTGVTHSAVMVVAPNGTVRSHLFSGALPIDVAVNPADGTISVALAGSSTVARVHTSVDDGELFSRVASSWKCGSTGSPLETLVSTGDDLVLGIAYDSTGGLLVQTERGVLHWDGRTQLSVELPPAQMTLVQRHESGYQLFHREAAPGGIACATCHPEALDDGRTWSLPEGTRRTQTLVGGAVAIAPFHWDGSLPSMSALMDQVFVKRMGGAKPEQPVVDELVMWLGAQAAPKSDAPSSAAGKALFEGRAGCSGCHFGPRLTNAALADVGTGGTFKVPSLVGVGARFPLMHSGCAATFAQRFDPACGGTAHGTVTSQKDVADLSAYLSSL
jgi:hypothetical protein